EAPALLARVGARRGVLAEGARNDGAQVLGVARLGEVAHPGAPRAAEAGAELRDEARLADASRPRDGDEARVVEQRGEALEVVSAADEAVSCHGTSLGVGSRRGARAVV